MKTVTTTLLILISLFVNAQDRFTASMQTAIGSLYSTQHPSEYAELTNKFTRIGEAETDRWEPHYYAALASVFKSFRIQEAQVKDEVLDQAHLLLNQAEERSQNNSEIIALRGFIDMMKVSVDPGTRGQTLSPKVYAAFGRALELNPNNPRAMLFMGQMKMGTAQFFGTGMDEACQYIVRSSELFENIQPKSVLDPAWGESMVPQYLQACNQSTEEE